MDKYCRIQLFHSFTTTKGVVSYAAFILLYFIADVCKAAIKKNKTFILLQHLFYFTAYETTPLVVVKL